MILALRRVRDLLEMIKFSHTLFALPFAVLGGLMAAWNPPPQNWQGRWQDWLGIVACMVTARSAAMSFNRWADRSLDARNPRTSRRHLPAGILSERHVLVFCAVNSLLFIAATLLFLPNPWPLGLSIPVLAWLLGYSFSKRFTSLAHFWLGAALMFAPMAAWIALRGSLAWPPALLGLAVFFWVTGFDIIYACQDAEFDRDASLRSIPARLGIARALQLAAALHALTLLALGMLAWTFPAYGPLFQCAVVAVAALLLAEHLLVRPDDLARVNIAFFQVNIAISLGLLLAGSIDLVV